MRIQGKEALHYIFKNSGVAAGAAGAAVAAPIIRQVTARLNVKKYYFLYKTLPYFRRDINSRLGRRNGG